MLQNAEGQGADGCWCAVAGFAPIPLNCFDFDFNILSATIGVPGNRTYRLRYTLACSGRKPNASRSMVEAYSGTVFPSIVLQDLTDSDYFGLTLQDFPFNLPDGTTGIRLIFDFGVRPQNVILRSPARLVLR